jgi:hydrogenase nickel incorporation protein HypB
MGRFHRHDDGTEHEHVHDNDHSHEHEHVHDHGHTHDHGTDHDHHHPHEAAAVSEHGDHTGYQTGPERVEVLERIFDENDRAADVNRDRFQAAGVTAINLMSSPGSGKTAILQRTLEAFPDPKTVGIIEGDIETSIDADRLAGYGARISLLNTANGFGGECHLDAPMVASALDRLDLEGLRLVFIENVGNLVCPAEFEVGAHHRVMVFSVTEGEEKPLKYPVMFRSVEAVLVNKVDLLPHLDFDMELFRRNLRQVNPGVLTFDVSARTGEGFEAWLNWLNGISDRPIATTAIGPEGSA